MSLAEAHRYLKNQGFEKQNIHRNEQKKETWAKEIKGHDKSFFVEIEEQKVETFTAYNYHGWHHEKEKVTDESKNYRHKMIVNALINEEQKKIFKFEGFDRKPTPQGVTE